MNERCIECQQNDKDSFHAFFYSLRLQTTDIMLGTYKVGGVLEEGNYMITRLIKCVISFSILQLALKYHPDKNPDNPDALEKVSKT